MQESFTDIIAFNQLFSGEIAGVIMEFFFFLILKDGGRPADPTREEKTAYRRRGLHKAKPSTFREKKGEKGEGGRGV